MTSTQGKKGDFFGLFGCSTSSINKPSNDAEGEEGEIVEKEEIELNSEDFEALMTKYQNELRSRLDLKNSKECRICFEHSPRYTCPRCGLKTCSLKCCLFHKKHFSCTGIRERTSFVPLSSYTNKDLESDCSFLEEASESLVDVSRTNRNNFVNSKDRNKITNLVNAATKRSICFKKMPSTFKKAKLNYSLYLAKEDVILWDLEFKLPYCRGENATGEYTSVTLRKSRVHETKTLVAVIDDIFEDAESWKKNLEENYKDAPHESMTVAHYKNNEILVLFQHDSNKFYYLLDLRKTLAENFVNKTIVEFPNIVIITDEFRNLYNIKS